MWLSRSRSEWWSGGGVGTVLTRPQTWSSWSCVGPGFRILSIALLAELLFVNQESSTFKPSLFSTLILGVDVEAVYLHVVATLLVDGQSEGGYFEVSDGGASLSGQTLASTPPQCW